MLLASPNGIALTTPENIILQASQDIAESASGSINLSAQKNIIGHAQDDAIDAIAKKVIKLISTEDKIEITSPKEIVLTAGGSQLKINAKGVFFNDRG